VHTGFCCGNLRERTIGSSRLKRENNIKVDFKEVGWEVMDWIALA
jgi:hypothetical protein